MLLREPSRRQSCSWGRLGHFSSGHDDFLAAASPTPSRFFLLRPGSKEFLLISTKLYGFTKFKSPKSSLQLEPHRIRRPPAFQLPCCAEHSYSFLFQFPLFVCPLDCNTVFLPSYLVWLPCWPPRFGFHCQASLTLTVCVLFQHDFRGVGTSLQFACALARLPGRRYKAYNLCVALTRLLWRRYKPTVCVRHGTTSVCVLTLHNFCLRVALTRLPFACCLNTTSV
jgi:hypothetical protein